MPEIKPAQSDDVVLTREQLAELEEHRERLMVLERELSECLDEYAAVIERHYFNREHGYVQEQQQNLREIATIQGSLDKLGKRLNEQSASLKSRMIALESSLHGLDSGAREKTGDTADDTADSDKKDGKAEKKGTSASVGDKQDAPGGKSGQKKAGGPKKTPLVVREAGALGDMTVSGGELSLRVMFEQLDLAGPLNREVLNEISQALRKMLYDRKLIGYSKTSLVFGRNKTLVELIRELEPIFLSDTVRGIVLEKGLVTEQESGRLRLTMDSDRELVFTVGE